MDYFQMKSKRSKKKLKTNSNLRLREVFADYCVEKTKTSSFCHSSWIDGKSSLRFARFGKEFFISAISVRVGILL